MTKSIRRNPMIRAVAILALAMGLFAVAPAASGAAQACSDMGYGNGASLTATPGTVHPGDKVTVSGTGFPPNCILGLSVGTVCPGTHITDVTTDGNGDFSLDWTVPAGQAAGQITFCATSGNNVSVSAQVTVVTASTQTTLPSGSGNNGGSSTLPKTGSQVLPFVGGGVLLLVVGSLLVLSSRKRNAAR